jgi:hypothetical protein
MIIRFDKSAQLLVTQPDHAALAARIMRQWRADGFPESPRRASILAAIEEHDNGWQEVDAAPLVNAESGRILDFLTAPDSVRRGVWPRGIERMASVPYVAALVANHALHIFEPYRNDPQWSSFFAEIEGTRAKHLEAAWPRTLTELQADYAFLRIADLASLTFCNGWSGLQSDDSQYTMRLDDGRLIITPDPFEGNDVPLEVAARELPDRLFNSLADARRAFVSAPTVRIAGMASGLAARST